MKLDELYVLCSCGTAMAPKHVKRMTSSLTYPKVTDMSGHEFGLKIFALLQ